MKLSTALQQEYNEVVVTDQGLVAERADGEGQVTVRCVPDLDTLEKRAGGLIALIAGLIEERPPPIITVLCPDQECDELCGLIPGGEVGSLRDRIVVQPPTDNDIDKQTKKENKTSSVIAWQDVDLPNPITGKIDVWFAPQQEFAKLVNKETVSLPNVSQILGDNIVNTDMPLDMLRQIFENQAAGLDPEDGAQATAQPEKKPKKKMNRQQRRALLSRKNKLAIN